MKEVFEIIIGVIALTLTVLLLLFAEGAITVSNVPDRVGCVLPQEQTVILPKYANTCIDEIVKIQ